VARAERGRRRGGLILGLAIALVAIGAIAILVVRPVWVTGVSPDALEASLKRVLEGPLAPTCEEVGGERWRCVAAAGDTARRAYTVDVDDWGCWDLRGTGGDASGACIWVRDFVDIE
jgi:hypothetical protein